MISNYYRNKERAIYRSDAPTLTDQSQAHDTDVNIIVKKYTVTGTAPGAPGQPMYIDTTEAPTDLRGMLEYQQVIEAKRRALPEKFRNMELAELLAQTPEMITKILTPQEDKPKDDK